MQKRGLIAFWKDYDRELYVKAAQLADELGYHSFWVPEGWGYEIFQLLTEVALKTENIQLGTGIVNVFSRSPALIAMSAATLDEISDGRLILGIGTSSPNVIQGLHGQTYSKPLTQTRDVIRMTRALLAGKGAHEAGAKLHDYRPFKLEMDPTRREIPIYVASLKQKSIESIGECADGWIPTFWPFARLHEGHEWIANGAAKAGRDPSEVTTAPYVSVIPTGTADGKKRAAEIIAFYIGGMGEFYRNLLTGFGYGDVCARVVEVYKDKSTRRDAWKQVSEEMIDALMIAGDPEYCVEELQKKAADGLDLPIINLPPKTPWPIIEMFIRGLAPS